MNIVKVDGCVYSPLEQPGNTQTKQVMRGWLLSPEGKRGDLVVVVMTEDPRARMVPARAPRGALAPWQEQRIAAHIRENLGASLRGSELAATVQLSSSYFIRAFKVSFGIPPVEYITRLRVLRAQGLMLSTDNSLAEVALTCGWSDQSHFSRRFQRVVGVSPGVWRRQHRFGSGRDSPRLMIPHRVAV